jgi:signal transduction histidine kinase
VRARDAIARTRLRLPIRLKLAVVSAGLTFVILLLFAVVIGAVAEQKVRGSFDSDLRGAASDVQDRVQRHLVPTEQGGYRLDSLEFLSAAATGRVSVRVIDRSGRQIAAAGPARPAPPIEGVQDAGGYRVVSRPIFAPALSRLNPFGDLTQENGVVGYVQYGKPEGSVTTTIARVRLFLALGVLGGTGLAFLAGFAVARRAMRPIAGLTHAAREVARTRDPDVALPKPVAHDEVAELAYTLEDMLRELGRARTETEAALTRQREFVADASHELRTPLTSILANLELLETELRGDQAEMAGSALRSSRRMRRLVADLLLLARADAGREAPRKAVDLAAVAREAAAEAAPLGAEGQVAIDAPGTATVEGVPDDLHRLALNLIENALIHTPAGTPITVSVRRDAEHAVLEVADRGPGVPTELHERVFERFARGDGKLAAAKPHDTIAPSGRRGGSGLGLAIVRAVAEAHGGGVTLYDAEGGGARFTVVLPAATRDSAILRSPPQGLRDRAS